MLNLIAGASDMDTTRIFDQVADGELSPADGAKLLQAQREQRRKPDWMPRWAYVFVVLVVTAVLAPFSGHKKSA